MTLVLGSLESEAGPILIGLLVVGAIVMSLLWHTGRSQTLISRWAAEQGFEVLACQYRLMFRGPFSWSTSKGQTVYRVTVRDRAGRLRYGWVRCGSWLLGLLSDRVEVRWERTARDP